MAVTTGTTWDIVLNDTSLVSTASAPPSATPTVSPRAAYQAALYGRAIIVDLRDAATRLRDGSLPADLGATVVAKAEVSAWIQESLATHLIVLDDGPQIREVDGVALVALAASPPQVSVLDGGFRGWQEAGLPVSGL